MSGSNCVRSIFKKTDEMAFVEDIEFSNNKT